MLLGLVWGGIAISVQAERFSHGALVALTGSILTATGILHRNLWDPDSDPLSGTYLLLAILLRVGSVAPVTQKSPPPPAPGAPIDSNENPDTLACDSPQGSPSAADEAPEP